MMNKRAEELGMQAYAYDENGWPSGFVGGKLLSEKENLATYLEMEEGTCVFLKYLKD